MASKLCSKKPLLLTCQIWRLLVNILPADEKYPVFHRGNLIIPIQIQLPEEKTLSELVAAFFKSILNFKHFEQKDDRHSFCITEISDSENKVRYMSKNCRIRTPLNKQHLKYVRKLVKSASWHTYHIHGPLASKLCSKKSPFLTWQILGLLVNTLAGNEKYHVLNRDNLRIPIKIKIPINIQLSEKEKTFSQFFVAFLKSRLNFEDFDKKMTVTAFVFPKLPTPERWLGKCLKSNVSGDVSTSNMANVP